MITSMPLALIFLHLHFNIMIEEFPPLVPDSLHVQIQINSDSFSLQVRSTEFYHRKIVSIYRSGIRLTDSLS